MRTTRLTAALLALSVPAAAHAKTVNWPQPGMNAAHTAYNAQETVISTANVGSLKQKWAFATGAEIYAAPVRVGKRAFVLSSDGNLYAINATTGAKLWTFQVNKNGTPQTWGVAASSKIVYVNCQLDYDSSIYLGHAGLCALNAATGAKLWDYAITMDGTNPVDSAPYNPPVLDGDTVFLGESDSASFAQVGYVVALNATTGVQGWLVGNCNDSGANDCYSVSSAPIAASGGSLYYNSGEDKGAQGYQAALCQHSAASGATGWCHYTFEREIAVAAGGGKVVFVDSNNGSAIVVALKQSDGSVAWSAAVGGQPAPNPAPAIANDVAYVPVIGSNAQGSLYALSMKSGKVLWSYACGGAAGCLASGVSVANGVLHALCRNGTTEQCAFDAKTGAVLRVAGNGGDTPAAPIVADGAELSVCSFTDLCRFVP